MFVNYLCSINLFTKNCRIPLLAALSQGQTSNFSCAEPNVNELSSLFHFVCIRFGTWKVRPWSKTCVDRRSIQDLYTWPIFIQEIRVFSHQWPGNHIRTSSKMWATSKQIYGVTPKLHLCIPDSLSSPSFEISEGILTGDHPGIILTVPSFVREQLNSLEHQLKRHLRPQYSIRFAEICEKRHKALWKTTIVCLCLRKSSLLRLQRAYKRMNFDECKTVKSVAKTSRHKLL